MTDNEKEYCNREFKAFLKENGISRRLTGSSDSTRWCCRTNETNSCGNDTVFTVQTGLRSALWAKSLAASNYIPTSTELVKDRSPDNKKNEEELENEMFMKYVNEDVQMIEMQIKLICP